MSAGDIDGLRGNPKADSDILKTYAFGIRAEFESYLYPCGSYSQDENLFPFAKKKNQNQLRRKFGEGERQKNEFNSKKLI